MRKISFIDERLLKNVPTAHESNTDRYIQSSNIGAPIGQSALLIRISSDADESPDFKKDKLITRITQINNPIFDYKNLPHITSITNTARHYSIPSVRFSPSSKIIKKR